MRRRIGTREPIRPSLTDIRNEELMMSHYLYKVIPRRPTFATDMSDDERAII